MSYTVDAPPAPTAPKPAWWRRHWVQLVAVAVVAAGIAGATASGDDHASELAAAKTHATELSAQVTNLQSRLDTAEAAAEQARQDADNAVVVAQRKVRAEDAAARRRLQAQTTALSARSHRLDVRERKVTGEERAWAANTIPGDGLFAVGKEVAPGLYHADASTGCYWSRLASFDTSNINDNGNVDGPVTVQILPTDKAFETDGCADWHKVG